MARFRREVAVDGDSMPDLERISAIESACNAFRFVAEFGGGPASDIDFDERPGSAPDAFTLH